MATKLPYFDILRKTEQPVCDVLLLELNETDSVGLENYLCYGEGQMGLSVSSRGFVPLSDS